MCIRSPLAACAIPKSSRSLTIRYDIRLFAQVGSPWPSTVVDICRYVASRASALSLPAFAIAIASSFVSHATTGTANVPPHIGGGGSARELGAQTSDKPAAIATAPVRYGFVIASMLKTSRRERRVLAPKVQNVIQKSYMRYGESAF